MRRIESNSKSVPTLEDESVYRRYLDFGSLVTGGRVTPQWLPDGSSFWYATAESKGRQIVTVDPVSNTVTPLADSEGDRLRGQSAQPTIGTFTQWKFIGTGRREPSPEALSPDGRWIAGIDAHNLTLRRTDGQQTVKVTKDGTPLAFWDVEGALWNPWSSDGLHLAVFKQHTEGMPRIPSVEWLKPLPEAHELIAMPAGGTLQRSDLYILNLHDLKPEQVNLGETADHYLRILAWLPDGSALLVARYNRLFSRVEILRVQTCTRAVQTVLSEESPTFVANHHEALWSLNPGFTLLGDGSGFIWNSERDGWDHLYLYDMEGRLVRQLTRGEWRVKDVVRVDQAEGWIYFTGHADQERPYDTHLYRVRLSGEGFSQLTEGQGQHAVNVSPSAKFFTDTWSAVDISPRTVLRQADGKLVRTLSEADITRLRAVGWVEPKEYVVRAADGVTDLWATLYFPYNFDPDKRYPLVEHIYGGPQTVWRPLDFGDQPPFPALAQIMNFNYALANLGFIVVTLDGRGTPERSKAFHDAIYRKWGQFEIADHAGAIRQLGERLHFLDLQRVGIWGLSWGGYFAFRALTQASDLYKVGIAEVPAFDPRRMVLYEPYLGLPQEHERGYDAADPFLLAPHLEGDLLLIAGLSDPFTPADFYRMTETLVRLGKQHRVMIYPSSGHVAEGVTADYNLELKKRFLVEHLMRP